jgi:hypothetical protein
MFTTLEFLTFAQWLGLATLGSLILTIVAFRLEWGIRFRLVGLTGFLAVIVVGSFGLSLGLLQRTTIPGAAPFTVVYDTGGTQAVISVSPDIEASTLEATLRQAAYNLFSPGRSGQLGQTQLIVRARTLIHPKPGVSEPLFLGRIRRSLAQRDDENMTVEINHQHLNQLQNSAETLD